MRIKKNQIKIFFYSTFLSPYQKDFFEKIKKISTLKVKAIFINKIICNYRFQKKPNYWYNYLENVNLLKEIDKFKINLLIIGGYKVRLILQLILLCFKKKIPFCLWLEYPKSKIFFLDFLRNILIFIIAKRAKFILAIGLTAQKFYKNFNNKVVNFPYSINLEDYKKKKNYPSRYKKITFIFVGQLIHRKGIDQLIKAFNLLNYENAYLKILGSGNYEKKIIKSTNKNISYLGFLNQKNIIKHLYKSDILIFPSRFDGWGVVVTQAMAAGLAIIGSKSSMAIKDLIKDRFNGVICKTDKYSILKSMEYYLYNFKKIKIHGQINKNKIFKSLCNSKIAARYFKNNVLKLV
jgi:glycosyltransferase involved in cell wall biosynthesis